MTNTVKMELAAANRQLASDSPQDSPVPDKQTVSQRKEKRLKWRTTVEDKSSMFSSAWNELYNVLGEYKAVLLKRDEIEEHYDETSDVDRLRNELLEKDQVIFEKENEIQTVRDQASEYRRKFEQSQLEVSVKESLLKKYQGEILQKEQLLLEARTKTTRLESKIRLLETQVSNSGLSEPPRKIVRVTQPAATPVGTPVRAAPTTPVGGPVRAAATPTRGGRQVATRGRSPMSTRRTQREPTPEVVETPPICLDDDDDDVVVEQQPNQNQNASLQDDSSASNMATLENEGGDTVYMEVWPEEGTESGTPGTSQDQSQEFVEEHEGLEQWTGDMTGMVADQGGTEQQAGSQGNKRRLRKRGSSAGKVRNRQFSCTECSERFPSQAELGQHRQKSGHDVRLRTCSVCAKAFSSVGCKVKHEKEVHSPGSVDCGICDRVFKSANDAHAHRNRHETKKNYPCEKCDKRFICKQHLAQHDAEQHSEAPSRVGAGKDFSFLCSQCMKYFRTEGARDSHQCETLSSHDGDKATFLCEHCGMMLSDKAEKQKHESELHGVMKKLVCKFCGKEFKRFDDLQQHEKRHKAKDFPCAMCEKTFLCRKHLERHMPEEHPDMLACPVCSRGFPNNEELNAHKQQEHYYQYLCQCGRVFKVRQSLIRHAATCTKGAISGNQMEGVVGRPGEIVQYYCQECRTILETEEHECVALAAQYVADPKAETVEVYQLEIDDSGDTAATGRELKQVLFKILNQ